jgi:F5/8 type C domain
MARPYNRTMARSLSVSLAALVLAGACAANPPSVTPAATGQPTSTPGPTTTSVPSLSSGPTAPPATSSTPVGSAPALPPAHLIAVRDGSSGRQLYDLTTGQQFIARGVNLLHLETVGNRRYDTLFGSRYDPAWVEAKLGTLADLGYNTVRVFLDLCADDCLALAGGGLSGTYLDHVADFIARAKSHGVFVMPTSNDLPDTADYGNSVPCCSPFAGYRNSDYLAPAGQAAVERYWRDIVGGLIAHGAATDDILGYELINEQFTFLDAPPLSLRSGSVDTADGQTWDMSNEQTRRQMVESNVVALADRVRTAIRQLDPTALVTMGFFAPNEPVEWRPGDNRLVLTRSVLERSTLDFADLHAYPGGSLDIAAHLAQFGVRDAVQMPLIMGEMGAFRSTYTSAADGAEGLVSWQVDSCTQFQGWLLWLEAGSDVEVWGGSEDDGVIDTALSPRERPDPCASGKFVRTNLALGATVRASAELPDNAAALACDGELGTSWIAGGAPPQWLEVDLPGPTDIGSIELVVAQTPAGTTRHRVLVGVDRSHLREVAVLRGTTADGDVLTVQLSASDGAGMGVVRVETTASPSWVAWREVRVFAP